MDILFIQNLGPQGYVNLKFQISDAICKMLAFTLEFQIPQFQIYTVHLLQIPPHIWQPELHKMNAKLQIMHLKLWIMHLKLQICI